MNSLKEAARFHITNRGYVYTGRAPFSADKMKDKDMKKCYNEPWLIGYEGMKDKLWRVTAIESFCIQWIRKGDNIGLLVEEWVDK